MQYKEIKPGTKIKLKKEYLHPDISEIIPTFGIIKKIDDFTRIIVVAPSGTYSMDIDILKKYYVRE